MDPATAKLLIQLGTYGPLGIMAAIGFVLFFLQKKETREERKKSEKLADKLHELGLESIKADMEHTKTYEALERVMDAALRCQGERNG